MQASPPDPDASPENVLSTRNAASMTDIDEIAVERATQGDRSIHLNRAELFLAFTALNATGMGAARIGERLGVSERSVVRWRVGRAFPQCRPGVDTSIPLPKPYYQRIRRIVTCEDCGESTSDSHIARHRRRRHATSENKAPDCVGVRQDNGSIQNGPGSGVRSSVRALTPEGTRRLQ